MAEIGAVVAMNAETPCYCYLEIIHKSGEQEVSRDASGGCGYAASRPRFADLHKVDRYILLRV